MMSWKSVFVFAALISAAPARAEFYVCAANSESPRGRGLIITSVLSSTVTDDDFATNVFRGYLRKSYAPYGNGWIFTEKDAQCNIFTDRQLAEEYRRSLISRVQQPMETIFNILFALQ